MMSRSFVTSSSIVLLLVACGGSSVVGRTDTTRQLQKTKDGGATGNGSTCTWANTSIYDELGKGTNAPSYTLGEEFKSIDTCNDCTCTERGISCTIRSCEPVACQNDAQQCLDGSFVGRSGPSCEFVCPGDVTCDADAKKCPDGSYVGRVAPSCAFKPCPNGEGTACPALAKQCPDGSYVGATGPDCAFICPGGGSCKDMENVAADKISAHILQNQTCNIDADCTFVAVAADCVDRCALPMAKSGQAGYEAMVRATNEDICPEYQRRACTLERPPCAPSPNPTCGANKKCQ